MTNATPFLAYQRIREAQQQARDARLVRRVRHPRRTLLSRIRGEDA
jgi:hypothetical protein